MYCVVFVEELLGVFNGLCPEKKAVTCLEDLQRFAVKEFKEILKGYKEKPSGCTIK